MSKITVNISEEYKSLIDSKPNVINELLSDYVELEQDKITKNELENNENDFNLNLSLKAVLGI